MDRLFPTGKSSVKLREIISDDHLDEYLKNYFTSEIEWAIYREHTVRESHPYFDIKILSNKDLNELLNKHYFENARFEKSKLEDLLEKALRLRANFLIRPVETLKNFIFVGTATKPVVEVLFKLNFFTDYQYLVVPLREFAETRLNDGRESVLGDSEFSHKIRDIDEKYFFSLPVSDFAHLVHPIFQFIGGYYNEQIVSLAAIELFFYDKNMARVAEYLNKVFSEKNREFIRKEELMEAIQNLIQSLIVSYKPDTLESIENYGYVAEEVSPQSEFIEKPENPIEEYENYGSEIEMSEFGGESFDESDIQFDKSFTEYEGEKATLPDDLEETIGNLNDIEWMISDEEDLEGDESEHLHPKFAEISSRISQKIQKYSGKSEPGSELDLELHDENYFEDSESDETTIKHQMRKTLFDLSKKLNADLHTLNEDN